MSIKPHNAFFIVIFFICGVLVGHYLPFMDSILPEFEGKAPSLSDALKDVLERTGESLTGAKEQITEEEFKEVEVKPKIEETKVIEKQGAYKFLESVVTISQILSAKEMKVRNADMEEIFIILEGVDYKFEQYVEVLKKYLIGQRLWCKPAIPHSANTKSLVVYAYVIPKSWKVEMGTPQLTETLLLNRIINQQFIKTEKK